MVTKKSLYVMWTRVKYTIGVLACEPNVFHGIFCRQMQMQTCSSCLSAYKSVSSSAVTVLFSALRRYFANSISYGVNCMELSRVEGRVTYRFCQRRPRDEGRM